MKFSCSKTMLNNAVSICNHAVSSKSSTQILEGLLISAENNIVKMTGFDYKIGICHTFDAVVSVPGSVVVKAKLFADIIRKMPDEDVEIDVDDNLIVTLCCGRSKFNFPGLSAHEYPELPIVSRDSGVSISSQLMKEVISNTLFAVSVNESKPVHTGALFKISEKTLTVVAIDGYRLAMRNEEIERSEGSEDFSFVVPGDSLREISRILPDSEDFCMVFPERKHALFEFEDTLITTRLLEGEFLDYEKAIPRDHPWEIRVNVAELTDAMERVSLIVSERLKNPVKCIFDGPVLKLSCNTSVGRSYDECFISDCSEKIEIGFNSRYILDALKACPDDEVLLEIKSGLSPCNIKPLEGDKYLHMVLPVRLKAGE